MSAPDSIPSETTATEFAASPTAILIAASAALATIPPSATRAATLSQAAIIEVTTPRKQPRINLLL